MRKRLLLGLGIVTIVGSGAAAAWVAAGGLDPDPEPLAVPVEQKYEDIQRAEYEKWMQDLGYTE